MPSAASAASDEAGDESAFANPDTSAFDAGSSSEEEGEGEEAVKAGSPASQQQQPRQSVAGAARDSVQAQLATGAPEQPVRCMQHV
jgi:hypothetical protein